MSDPHAPSHVPVSIQHPHLNIDFTAHAVDQIHSSPCNIGGWDAAVIISIAELNKGIASAHSFPASFSHTGLDGTEAKMSGSFSNWRVGSGGSASILHMHVSLSTTTLEYNGQTLDLSGATIVIELKLEFTKGSHSPKTEELKIRQTPNPASSPCLSVISLLLPGDNTIGFLAKAVFSGLMNDWLNSNLALFTHTFGVVTLNTDPDDLYAWLKPSLAGYAFADSAGSERNGAGEVADRTDDDVVREREMLFAKGLGQRVQGAHHAALIEQ